MGHNLNSLASHLEFADGLIEGLRVESESILPPPVGGHEVAVMDGFAACIDGLDDPRTGNAARHDVLAMLLIALCTVLPGCEHFTDYGGVRPDEAGISARLPQSGAWRAAHDSLSRLFRRLDPEPFRGCFQRFMNHFAAHCQGVVAIDGKVLHRSFNKADGQSVLHMGRPGIGRGEAQRAADALGEVQQ